MVNHRRRDQRNVHLAFGEAGHLYREHIDAVEQVRPEGALVDPRLNVLVGGADKPEIHLDLVIASDPLYRPVFQNAQKLRLKRQRHVADLVEKKGAATGKLDTALARLVGAGEGAFFMAEDLGFEKLGRDRRAIDRHQPAATPGGGVDGACHQLLSGAGLAENKDACRRLGNNFN